MELVSFTQWAEDAAATAAARDALGLPPGSLAALGAGTADGYELRVRHADGRVIVI